MNAPDPIQTARTLVRLGLTAEALAALERAREQHPARADIAQAIAELRQAGSVSGRLSLAFDLLLIWLLLIGVGALLAWLGYHCAVALMRWWAPADGPWLMPVMIGSVLLGCMLFTRIWMHAFLHAWFCYLKYLSHANPAQVEMYLPRYFKVAGLQPMYGKVRRRYFQ